MEREKREMCDKHPEREMFYGACSICTPPVPRAYGSFGAVGYQGRTGKEMGGLPSTMADLGASREEASEGFGGGLAACVGAANYEVAKPTRRSFWFKRIGTGEYVNGVLVESEFIEIEALGQEAAWDTLPDGWTPHTTHSVECQKNPNGCPNRNGHP